MTRMPRHGLRRIAVALASAVLASLALAGCASTGPAAPEFAPGMANILLRQCIQSSDLPPGSAVTLAAGGWKLVAGDATVSGGLDGTYSLRFRDGSDFPVSADARAAGRFHACMDQYPIDYSLVVTDSIPQRMRLYDYYIASLLPCLRRIGQNPTTPPTPEIFYGEPFGAWDPYVFVTAHNAREAEAVQNDCPPAPADVLAESRAVAASTPVRRG